MLGGLGFVPCRTAACVFYYPAKNLKIVSHVDDFLCAGDARNLLWLKSKLKEAYEVDGEVLGLGSQECLEGKFLG